MSAEVTGDCTARLQDQVRAAMETGAALEIRGGGSKQFLGRRVSGTTLDTRDHHGIVHYDPTELVLTARCGTSLAKIEAALDEHGQMLPCEPPQFSGSATFGGMVAAGLSGPRRPWSGAVRDFVLGCRIIDGHARCHRFGGEVMKNVAGYDMSRLMAGSFGSLSLLTEISVKVLPRPRHHLTLRLDINNREALRRLVEWAHQPLPISGACHDGSALFLRLEGGHDSVNASARRIGGDLVSDNFWQALRDHQLPFFDGPLPLWRLSLPPATPLIDLPGPVLIDWAGAQRWVRTRADATTMRSIAKAAGGHATAYSGEDDLPFHPLPPGLLALHRRLKERLDPQALFNPGRLYPEL